MSLSIGTKIAQTERVLASLREEEESMRRSGINSRKAFYEKQAEIFGKIMKIRFELELIHCVYIPFAINTSKLMFDFRDYPIELGLDGALQRAMELLNEV